MTYSMAHSLGAAEGIVNEIPCAPVYDASRPRWKGGPEHAVTIGEKGTVFFDKCCPVESWSNQTFLAVGGSQGLRAMKEARIRGLFTQLDELLILEGNIPGGSGISPILKERLLRAEKSFLGKFPGSRWVVFPSNYSNKNCTGSGTYSTFAQSKVVPTSKAELDVIMAVPPSHPEAYVSQMPRLQEMFSGGAPGPWLKEFLDVFAPATLGERIAMNTKTAELSRLSKFAPSLALLRPVEEPSMDLSVVTDSTTPPSSKSKFPLVLGGLVVAGAAAYFYTKR